MGSELLLVGGTGDKVAGGIVQDGAGQSRYGLGRLGVGGQVAEGASHDVTNLEAVAPADYERVLVGPEQAAAEELVA